MQWLFCMSQLAEVMLDAATLQLAAKFLQDFLQGRYVTVCLVPCTA